MAMLGLSGGTVRASLALYNQPSDVAALVAGLERARRLL